MVEFTALKNVIVVTIIHPKTQQISKNMEA